MPSNSKDDELIKMLTRKLDELLDDVAYSQMKPEEKLDFITSFYLKHGLDKLDNGFNAQILYDLFQKEFNKNRSKLFPRKGSSSGSDDKGLRDSSNEIEAIGEDPIDINDFPGEVFGSDDANINAHEDQEVIESDSDFEDVHDFDRLIIYVKDLLEKSSIVVDNEDIIALIGTLIETEKIDVDKKQGIIYHLNNHPIDFIFKLIDVSDLNFIEEESLKSFYDKGYESFVLKNFTPTGRSRIFREAYDKITEKK